MTKKSTTRQKRSGDTKARLHPMLSSAITRARRQLQTRALVDPIRSLFAQILTGEMACDENDIALVKVPRNYQDPERPAETTCVYVSTLLGSWIGYWGHIAPDLPSIHFASVCQAFKAGEMVVEDDVLAAQAEFEALARRIESMPERELDAAIIAYQQRLATGERSA